MRKENSKFITKFVTNEGSKKSNRDYFAYVELDDYGCWLLADGLDTDEEKLSAEIVAGSIIEDFTENPKMSKKTLKRYLKTANEMLLKETRINLLKASIVVIISDYHSIIYGSIGNTRLYHYRKDNLLYRTKDHSVAELMLKLGKVEKNNINQNIEKNNLYEYLGKKKQLKMNISNKKIELKEGDMLLLATVGYWENMKDIEIGDILKASEDVESFVMNLENMMLEKENPHLNNYTIVSISIQKIFIENVKKSIVNTKTIVAASLVIVLIVGVLLFRNHLNKIKIAKSKMQQMKISKLKAEKLKLEKLKAEKLKLEKLKAKKLKLEQLKSEKLKEKEVEFQKTKDVEKNGDDSLLKKDYVTAKENYNEALAVYTQLDKKEDEDRVKGKIKTTEKLEKSDKLLLIANSYYESGDYINAKLNYIKAKELLDGIEGADSKSIDNSIFNVETMSKAKDLEKVGDIYFSNENYDKSIEKYGLAKEHFLKVKKYDTKEITSKLEKSKILNNAKQDENAGEELYNNQKYIKSIEKFELAKESYKKAKSKEKENKMKDKLEKIKRILTAINLESEGDQLKTGEDLAGSKSKYEESKAIYKEVGLNLKEKDVNDKLVLVNLSLLKQAKIKDAESIESDGDSSLGAKDFDGAKEKYEKAKKTYQEVQKYEEAGKLDIKLKKVEEEREYFKANSYKELADTFFKQKKYDDAIANYEIAKNSYLSLEKTKEYMEMEKSIKDAKKKKKILGIF
ncbi:PP2C family protein-serine/threonine phosphatase [Haliovirga abyssi]|uniref:PPM-type phosphatase domain-containing protein n=1 Tax=Haliovirga abyssi TaxID=2996794 RepID=A0AAU9DIM7_9FUSO|nr:hypothetical protein [Haliovirga abyssi]BDU50609.1 hypothetical protein HLVA_11780 [Haliovirga abyssi]